MRALEIEHVPAKLVGGGVPERETGELHVQGLAQRSGDGFKQRPCFELGHYGVVHLQQETEPIALDGQLLPECRGGFEVERILHGDGDLPRYLAHEPDFFAAVCVLRGRAEGQAAKLPPFRG